MALHWVKKWAMNIWCQMAWGEGGFSQIWFHSKGGTNKSSDVTCAWPQRYKMCPWSLWTTSLGISHKDRVINSSLQYKLYSVFKLWFWNCIIELHKISISNNVTWALCHLSEDDNTQCAHSGWYGSSSEKEKKKWERESWCGCMRATTIQLLLRTACMALGKSQCFWLQATLFSYTTN